MSLRKRKAEDENKKRRENPDEEEFNPSKRFKIGSK
jgi:hypothetical protein